MSNRPYLGAKMICIWHQARPLKNFLSKTCFTSERELWQVTLTPFIGLFPVAHKQKQSENYLVRCRFFLLLGLALLATFTAGFRRFPTDNEPIIELELELD